MAPAERLPTVPVFDDLIPAGPRARALADGDAVDLGQARYELDRAVDFGTLADRGAWAERWGESALAALARYADGGDPEDWFEPSDKDDLEISLTAVQSAFDHYLEAPSVEGGWTVRELIAATLQEVEKL